MFLLREEFVRFCEILENGGKTIVDKKWLSLPQRDASQQLALATARLLLPQGALLRNIRRAGAGIIPRVAKEVDPAAREKGISREVAETIIRGVRRNNERACYERRELAARTHRARSGDRTTRRPCVRTTALRSTAALCGAPARALLVRCLYFARYVVLARRLRGRVRARAVHGAAPHEAIPHNGARARACPPLRLRLGVHAADLLAFFLLCFASPLESPASLPARGA